jgi:hypothetical protein
MLTEETAQITQPQNAEQLQRKIEKTVDTIIKFSEIQKQTEKSVRQQLHEIVPRQYSKLRLSGGSSHCMRH